MQISVKILSLLCAAIFMIIFISLVRRRSIKPGYSFLWLLITILMFGVVIFERVYKMIANLLNIPDASFLIIISVIFFLLVYVLYLSIKMSEMSDRMQELISHIAILKINKNDSTQGDKAS